MKAVRLKDTYPIQVETIAKEETTLIDAKAVIDYLKSCIDEHPVAVYIGEFDHYAHTTSLPEHTIDETIVAAKIVVFCFGKELPSAEMAAVRPRSIAVVEREDAFVVSFMDAPNPVAHAAMTTWVEAIRNRS